MKKINKKSPPTLILIALAVAVVFGYLSYWQNIHRSTFNVPVDTHATTTAKTESVYTYKTVKVGAKTFTEKYKDGELVETVLVK